MFLYTTGKARNDPLKLTEEDSIALLNWFEEMELLKLAKLTYNAVSSQDRKILEEKAKEFNCASVHLFNWIKSKRRYYTRTLFKFEMSGSGKF